MLRFATCGEIVQRKREPLKSGCGAPLGYILVGVVLDIPSWLLLAHIFSCDTTLCEFGHIPCPFVVYQESPSLIIYSLIHKLKIDQEQLQYIQHSNNTPFQTPFQHWSFLLSHKKFSLIHKCVDSLYLLMLFLNHYCNLLCRFTKTPKQLNRSQTTIQSLISLSNL